MNTSCEFAETPSGSRTNVPKFSWIVSAELRNSVQTSYQVEVASDSARLGQGHADLWNSGIVLSNRSLHVLYGGKDIASNTKCYYRVTICDNHGNRTTSRVNNFTTFLTSTSDWKAKWIGAGPVRDPLPPKGFYSGAKDEGKSGDLVVHDGRSLLLRHGFSLSRKVREAMVFVTGLGLYELYINGKRVGDQQLSPSKTPYHKQVLFDAFDVTRDLVNGKNALAIHLGNGWYNPYKKWWQEYRMQWFGSKKAILQLQIKYTDETEETIVSDGNWKTAPGPSLYNCIYDGEIYDATKEIKGWTDRGFDDASWQNAVEVEAPRGKLIASDMPPLRIVQKLAPKKIGQPKQGVKIADFGQNFAGWTRITLKGARGTKVKVRYSEELDANGNLDVTCNENARATAEYVMKGEGIEVFEPRFTYFGFQFAEITAEPGLPELVKIEGCVVHSDNRPAGSFSCDNELVNKIHHATVWSQKSNMLGYPMDCPQRDERLGWMGDAQVTAEEAMFNFDMAAFYRNWFSGIRANQDAETGDIPIISPRPYIRDEGIEWSSSYLTMLWNHYRYYGDKELISNHYAAMSNYFRFLVGHAKGVIQPKGWIGDWGSRAKNWKEGDPESVPTAYFYLDALLLSKMAGLTGQKEDSVYFAGMAEKIKTAYNANFFHPDQNSYHDGSQMANAFPLYLGLVPEGKQKPVLANLVNQIMVADSGHLTTGILGTKYMPEVLSGYGRGDIVWEVVNRKGYPSWSEMMKKYNTMCEFWTLKQSHNHVMMGSIDSWFYDGLAGIKLSDEFPAYEKTVIHPYFADGLNKVDCSLQTARGKLVSNWERKGSALIMRIVIPFNCQSEVWIPLYRNGILTESGIQITSKKEITLLRKEGDFGIYCIGSGDYLFEIRYPAGKS